MKLFLVLTLFFTLVHLSYQAKIQPKILNGHEVDIKNYPYQAFLDIDGYIIKKVGSKLSRVNGDSQCGGSVLSKIHILTAAHCLNKVENNSMFTARKIDVFVGSSICWKGEKYIAKNWNIHPEYHNRSPFNDIAIIFLIRQIEFSMVIQTIRLPVKQSSCSYQKTDFAGQMVFVTGWGRTSANSDLSWKLLGAKMILSNQESCRNSEMFYPSVPMTLLCAIIPESYGQPYKGDSGGPVATNNTIYGIVSYGNTFPYYTKCFFTSVSHYLDWIHYTMGQI